MKLTLATPSCLAANSPGIALFNYSDQALIYHGVDARFRKAFNSADRFMRVSVYQLVEVGVAAKSFC